jgi:hypothetical protein
MVKWIGSGGEQTMRGAISGCCMAAMRGTRFEDMPLSLYVAGM